MSRIFKVIGIVAGAVILLFVAALVAVGMLFDPNDYKDQIVAAVNKATGRELTLDGDLKLSVFPTIRIAVGSAALSNAQGFGATPMAKIGSAELEVSVLPLLAERIQVGEARLHGLELNLARDARGRNNWQDLGGGATAGAPAPAPGGQGGGGAAQGLDLGVGAIDISDARVTWNDAATNSRWELTNFGLDAKGFGPGKRFPLEMRFSLKGADVAVNVDANAQATLALADDAYKLEQLDVSIDGTGPGWPGGAGKAALKVDSLAANLGKESLELQGLTLDALGITLAGSLTGQKLLSDLSLSGAVDIREFNPRNVLDAFKVALETADSAVLSRASAKANLLYTSREIGLRDMQLKLDDSTLTGRVGLEGDKIAYNLTVDDINIDRYLPPSQDSAAAGSPDEGSLNEVDLPLDALRKLEAAGDFKFGKAKFSGLTLTDATFGLTAADGKLRLVPKASLYGGTWNGQIDVDVQAAAAKATIAQQLQHVDLVPLGKDLLGSADVAGIGDVKLDLVASGTNVGEMRRGLGGNVSFSVTNGALEGIDLWFELRRARARIDKDTIPERGNEPRRTTFSSLSATGTIQDALLTNRDLTGVLDFMKITGTGTVNLLDNKVDFDLKAAMVDGPKLQSDPAMVKYAGQTLPLRVTGTIDEPSVLPDFGAIVKARVQNEAQEQIEEKKDEAKEKLRDRVRGLLNR